ncbi:ThiF family adenylyltransferase [Oscillochloris sp. ZM17-4]|uniref:ThiF family adenylyltransferase n=1 Tax=Oscillochloris sp. ZM17-4 TaxID=2866714 RepID=UPI001C732249|nr:ThiF family adenylyltransferase [Oscillochloris sp. ZM17-4]MBX0330036.1 ThiF family adenylyltransferase [Oscillochloris sp. ZM17-4]
MRQLQIEPALPLRIAERPFRVVVVGCGGTGSHLVESLARLCYHLKHVNGPAVDVLLIDGDVFEPKNVGRQLARLRDVGLNKAQALAARVNADYGLQVEAIPEMLDAKLRSSIIAGSDGLGPGAKEVNLIIVGCVDSVPPRALLHDGMPSAQYDLRWLWLDVGNHEHTGQVLLGSAYAWANLHGCLALDGLCAALPSPGLQQPDLVVPPPAPKGRKKKKAAPVPNCADDVASNRQAFGINATLAAIAAEYLTQLITHRAITRMRTDLDLLSMTATSVPITASALAEASGLTREELRGIAAPRPQKTWKRAAR